MPPWDSARGCARERGELTLWGTLVERKLSACLFLGSATLRGLGAGHSPQGIPLFLLDEVGVRRPLGHWITSREDPIRTCSSRGGCVEERESGLPRSCVLLPAQPCPPEHLEGEPRHGIHEPSKSRAGGSHAGVTGHLAGNEMQFAGNEMQFASTPSLDGFILLPKALNSCCLEPAPCRAGREGWRQGRRRQPGSLSKYLTQGQLCPSEGSVLL